MFPTIVTGLHLIQALNSGAGRVRINANGLAETGFGDPTPAKFLVQTYAGSISDKNYNNISIKNINSNTFLQPDGPNPGAQLKGGKDEYFWYGWASSSTNNGCVDPIASNKFNKTVSYCYCLYTNEHVAAAVANDGSGSISLQKGDDYNENQIFTLISLD